MTHWLAQDAEWTVTAACGEPGGQLTRKPDEVSCAACCLTDAWRDRKLVDRVGVLTDDDLAWLRSRLPRAVPR